MNSETPEAAPVEAPEVAPVEASVAPERNF